MKIGSGFEVRPLKDFSETETAGDWLAVYQETKTVEELLGLLHEGARYSQDLRVLDVYLAYAAVGDEGNLIAQKARSMLYHHILKKLDVGVGPFTLSNLAHHAKSPSPEKLLEFFRVPNAFPVQQPFQDDVYAFIEWYGKALLYVPKTDERWAQFTDVLVASLESDNGERYDKLIRQLLKKGGDPARNYFSPVLEKRLDYIVHGVTVSGTVHSVSEGIARREALLLSDLTDNTL